jgi:hypothetical protein
VTQDQKFDVTLYFKQVNMKKIMSYIIIGSLLFFYGCSKNDDLTDNITSLELSVNKDKIVADTSDYAIVKVVDQNGIDVTSIVTIYFGGSNANGPKVFSLTPGASLVYAKYKSIKSNEVAIEVIEDKNLEFEKNVLIEQYTGTWCGWCPRAINQINVLQTTDQKTIHIAHHLSDEFSFSNSMTLFQSFGFTGIPTVHADRSIVWNGSASEIAAMHSPSRIGISLDVTGDATRLNAAVKIKFGIRFLDGLEVTVFLLHDSLIANQANYYNTDPTSPYYKKGATMLDFIHRNVLVQAGTSILGEKIPVTAIDVGAIYTRNVEFTGFKCDDIKKIRIAAFVAYESGNKIDRVVNCQVAKRGEKKDFVYSGK